MPYMSIFNRRTTDIYLAIMASHLVAQGCFGFVNLERTTTAFSVVIQITGPPAAPAVGDRYTFCIKALRNSSVNFRLAWFVSLVIFDQLT